MRVSNQLPRVQHQVDLLEAAGFRIQLNHQATQRGRIHRGPKFKGITRVRIFASDTDVAVGIGKAYCSLQDNYSKVAGTQHAFHRAINDFYSVVGHVKANAVLHPPKGSTS